MSKTETFVIEDVGAQGDGIVHTEGKTYFVPYSIAGEEVEVRLDGMRGNVQRVCKPSPDRAVPSCPHFPTCGGCRMQHMNELAYAAWKTKQLKDLLGKNELGDIPLLPTFISPAGTRRRASMAAKSAGKPLIGFNAWHSHDLIDIQHCAVLVPAFMALLPKLRVHLKNWIGGKKSDIMITVLPNGIDIVLVGGKPLTLDIKQDFAAMAQECDIAQLSWKEWDKSAPEPIAFRKTIMIEHGTIRVPFPAGSFLQATACGEKALQNFAVGAVKGAKKVLDLFCGLGGFGLTLPEDTNLTFADLDGPAIAHLAKAVRGNPRIQTCQRDLVREPFMPHECNEFDAVIFDPPRGGAKAQAEQLAQSKVKSIIAISCDPTSFVRDANILIAGGYKLEKIQPVDQFLWSTHLELAAAFRR